MSDLWRDGRTTLDFWEWGPRYTIVPGRHIGADQAPSERGAPWDVPALVDSVVHHSVQTEAIGRVVVTDTGRTQRRYISYCHGFYGDPARAGDDLPRGARAMRLARSWESPGSAWDGVHCHVVVHDHPAGAYMRVGDRYHDPAVEIAAYNAAPAGGKERPLPTEEDEIMGARDDILNAVAALGAEAAANTARLRLEIRGHIFYDAGTDGATPFEATKHAALMNGAGRIIVMNADPVGQEASWRQDHYKFTDASRTAEANRVALNTAAFWNKVKDELTARSDDFYTVESARAWFAKRQEQIATADERAK